MMSRRDQIHSRSSRKEFDITPVGGTRKPAQAALAFLYPVPSFIEGADPLEHPCVASLRVRQRFRCLFRFPFEALPAEAAGLPSCKQKMLARRHPAAFSASSTRGSRSHAPSPRPPTAQANGHRLPRGPRTGCRIWEAVAGHKSGLQRARRQPMVLIKGKLT